MLPLSLLSTATGQAMLIELKNGDTYNGKLVGADTWMNVNLEDVICTSRDGDRFWKLPQCYIRGNSIKYLRIPDEIIDMVAEEEESRKKHQPGKGGRGGRVTRRPGARARPGAGRGRGARRGAGRRPGTERRAGRRSGASFFVYSGVKSKPPPEKRDGGVSGQWLHSGQYQGDASSYSSAVVFAQA